MSKLYASVDADNRKTTTKCGHRNMSAHIRGWNKGIKIEVEVVGFREIYKVYETGGSNNPSGTLIYTCEND